MCRSACWQQNSRCRRSIFIDTPAVPRTPPGVLVGAPAAIGVVAGVVTGTAAGTAAAVIAEPR